MSSAEQRLVRGRRGEPQLVLRASRSASAASSASSPACGADALDLGERRAAAPRLGGARVLLGRERLELGPVRRSGGRPPVAGEQARPARPGEAVERSRCAAGDFSAQLLGLAVHRDEVLAELLQHADRAPSGRRRRRGCGPPR